MRQSFWFACAVSLVFGAGSAACGGGSGTSGNLIVNGDGESAAGSTDGSPVPTPGWTVAGEATAIRYGTSGFVATTDPGPTDRGMNFLVGGENDETSSLTQSIDVSRHASAIDAGRVTYSLSGWLGGYQDQGDNTTVVVTFQGASGNALGSATIGPVTATDRANTTGLLQRSASGAVPAGTRSVGVVVTMTRTDGSNNDGYADDLSLVFDGV